MSKTKQILNAIKAGGLKAGEKKAEELGIGFYYSQFPGHFELWAVRNGNWVRQIYAS